MNFIDHEQRSANGIVYRGQRNATWKVESSLLRKTKEKIRFLYPIWEDLEDRINRLAISKSITEGVQVWQSYSDAFSRSTAMAGSDNERWLFGRHHGLLNPFIEFSKSPYVAAFFAAAEVAEEFEAKQDGDFAVYGLGGWLFQSSLAPSGSADDGLPQHAFQVNAARHGNPRGIAQRAVATYVYPQTDIETFVKNCHTEDPGPHLWKILLAKSLAFDALQHLERMNVTYMSLYPDDDGLAKHANLTLYVPSYGGWGSWETGTLPGFEGLMPSDPGPS